MSEGEQQEFEQQGEMEEVEIEQSEMKTEDTVYAIEQDLFFFTVKESDIKRYLTITICLLFSKTLFVVQVSKFFFSCIYKFRKKWFQTHNWDNSCK